ncbi:MAG: OmpH family outer membrane protein [Nitrospiraceae bacterium]
MKQMAEHALGQKTGLIGRAVLLASVSALLVGGGCAGGSSAPGSVRLGVVDSQKVLTETDAGKKAMGSLNSFMKNRQSLIELEEKELKRMEDDLIKQASVLSANAKKDREEQLRRRAMEFQQKVNEMNREIQEKQKEVLEAFREKVEKAVAKVAQQMGLQVVIEKGRAGSTVYNDSSLDLSARVIEEFGKEAP